MIEGSFSIPIPAPTQSFSIQASFDLSSVPASIQSSSPAVSHHTYTHVHHPATALRLPTHRMTANTTAEGRPPIPPGMDLAESRQGEARITSAAITALAVVFVALRLGTRIKRGNIGADDYMLLASLVSVG